MSYWSRDRTDFFSVEFNPCPLGCTRIPTDFPCMRAVSFGASTRQHARALSRTRMGIHDSRSIQAPVLMPIESFPQRVKHQLGACTSSCTEYLSCFHFCHATSSSAHAAAQLDNLSTGKFGRCHYGVFLNCSHWHWAPVTMHDGITGGCLKTVIVDYQRVFMSAIRSLSRIEAASCLASCSAGHARFPAVPA
jgi:hypothetical protein